MNEIADNFILARNIFIGSLAFYAGYSILTRFIIKPFVKTFKFLSNQTRDLKHDLRQKYGNGIAIVAGSTTGLGPNYASYLRKLGFETILLIDSDEDALSKQKAEILKYKKPDSKLNVHTHVFDFNERHI
jgi:hypothetical protein